MITQEEYKKRRDKVLSLLPKNSVFVLHSATYKTRSHDTEYPYRQDSNFYYLTGFKEDNSALMFVKSKKEIKTVLFVAKKDKLQELWNGKRVGVKKAKKMFLVDEVYEYDKLHVKSTDNTLLLNILKDMRLIKSKSEIELIKKAISITKEAHNSSIKRVQELSYEYELQAEFEYIFKKNGAYNDAYTSIIACGNSANTLHYISNNKKLKDGELVLIDAGCEYKYYASDITRTIAVSGKFTKPQQELYDLVLNTQREIISMIKPNILRSDLQKISQKLLTQGLVELGILKGKVKKLLKKEKFKEFYPHGIGHFMGLDVHDDVSYKYDDGKEIPLKEGMVLTIEPALYCNKKNKKIPKQYRGIGIRIEDNILVTKDGYENLSEGIVK